MQFFATIYALSCGKKLSPKVHLWRKNDKYEVWYVPNYSATLPSFSILKMVLCICVPKYLKKWNILKNVLCTCSQIFKKLKYFENGVRKYSQIFKKNEIFWKWCYAYMFPNIPQHSLSFQPQTKAWQLDAFQPPTFALLNWQWSFFFFWEGFG